MRVQIQNVSIRRIMETAIAENAIIIDVREGSEFRKGHIPMAVNAPLFDIQRGNVNFPRGRTLIFYCESGVNSMEAARIMAERGYRVYNAVGGILQYNKPLTMGRQ